ncbi:MAG: N-acetylmuramoyl-L-alanine amidase [Alphaproteobacteria bacterium]|nr:N-acetylmuramoyl-L-alanine amidase [Alphaproteobacteria bacterium]
MPFRLVDRPSPNHDARPAGVAVDMLVLHYTGMNTAEEALERLCDPAAKVSAHYTIDRDGTVYVHVPEERRAWHAGVSHWAGENGVNARSIGIELVNPGHEFGYVPFADDQIAALIDLARGILARHPIPARRVLGHSDVAPSRKTDPGELFPWKHLADFGIGIWPNLSSPVYGGGAEHSEAQGASFAANLVRFGYGVSPDVPLEAVVTAFQRHFRPSCIDGIADGECAVLLESLLVA